VVRQDHRRAPRRLPDPHRANTGGPARPGPACPNPACRWRRRPKPP